jgi:hypothetical protein
MRSIARTPTRVKALRDNIARYLKVHAETEGNMAIMRQRWASDQLPVVALDAANEPAHMIDDGIVSSALRRHVLENIPDEAVRESHIEGNPDTSETITLIIPKLLNVLMPSDRKQINNFLHAAVRTSLKKSQILQGRFEQAERPPRGSLPAG